MLPMKTSLDNFEYSPYAALFKKIHRWNEDNQKNAIDSTEEQILYRALIAEYDNQFLYVSDLLKSEKIGSQTTIHGRIKRLVNLGYVKLTICDADNRKKIIEPTQAAINFDQQRSIFLLMAANNKS